MTQKVTIPADGAQIKKKKERILFLEFCSHGIFAILIVDFLYLVATSTGYAKQVGELTAIRELLLIGIGHLIFIAVAVLLQLWANRIETEVLAHENNHLATLAASAVRPHN